jgi:Right handed beta helix region/CotH kinase protein
MIIKERNFRSVSEAQGTAQRSRFGLKSRVFGVSLLLSIVLLGGAFIGVAAERKEVFAKLKRTNVLDTVFNYFNSVGVETDHIFIDIKHHDFQKLKDWRKVALEQGQITSELKTAVPAKIRYLDKQMKAEVRFKGEWTDHLGANKWSFRINLKDDNYLWGMNAFSIQHPRTRSYIYEWIYHKALEREKIMAQRYRFINVTVNGLHEGIFAVEEHFTKHLIESNRARTGVMLQFSEDFRYQPFSHKPGVTTVSANTGISDPESSFPRVYGEKTIAKDPVLQGQYEIATNLLEAFRVGKLPTHRVFDMDRFALYFAVSELTGGTFAAYDWSDLRLVYNPLTSLIEPIGVEGSVNPDGIPTILCAELANPQKSFHRRLFEDRLFFRKYVQALEKVSQPQYLEDLMAEIKPELDQQLRIIHSEWPYWPYDPGVYNKNRSKIRAFLNPNKGLHAYLQNRDKDAWEFEMAAIQTLPAEIIKITAGPVEFLPSSELVLPAKLPQQPLQYQSHRFTLTPKSPWSDELVDQLTVHYRLLGSSLDRKTAVFPKPRIDTERFGADAMRRDPNHTEFKFLALDEEAKSITILEGEHRLESTLVLPAGYRVLAGPGVAIDLAKSAKIISYAPLEFVGEEMNPVRILTSDGTGQGLAVLKAGSESRLRHVSFSRLKNPDDNGWVLTGAVTFYESPVTLRDCEFRDNQSEDSLNIMRSDFLIDQCKFQNSPSDAFDGDFVKGTVKRSTFSHIQGDGVDVSGSEVRISDIFASNMGDKGVSLGEGSTGKGERISVIDSRIGMAAKDASDGVFEDVQITNCEFGLAVFQKKPEYGPARLQLTDLHVEQVKLKYLIEQGSRLIIDDEDRNPTHTSVKALLYSDEKSAPQILPENDVEKTSAEPRPASK